MSGVLDLTFIGLAGLFTVWNVFFLARYARYRRLMPTAELTWRARRPWFYNMCIGIGFFMVSMTALSLFVLDKSILSSVAQGLMAIYYTIAYPLSFQIQRGFYKSGIWFDRSFVPYTRVRRFSWREQPDLALVVTKEADLMGQDYARLQVPRERYGEARGILASHTDDRSLSVETGILGLAEETAEGAEGTPRLADSDSTQDRV